MNTKIEELENSTTIHLEPIDLSFNGSYYNNYGITYTWQYRVRQYLDCALWLLCAVLIGILLWNDYISERDNRNLALRLEASEARLVMLERTVIYREGE